MHSKLFDCLNEDEQCPHPDEILAYFLSMDSPQERQDMEDHLSRCSTCRMAVIQLRSQFSPSRRPRPMAQPYI